MNENMREHSTEYLNDDLHSGMRYVAAKAIALYAQGLLTVDILSKRMEQDWVKLYPTVVEIPAHNVLMRLAQRICSYELCLAWSSPDPERRELAYCNLQCHLRRSLLQTRYGISLHGRMYAIEDILNSTLEQLYAETVRKGCPGPDDPATFLKWTQTFVIRQARLYVQRFQRDPCLSLDEQRELFSEKLVDTEEGDPVKQVLLHELRQTLEQTILTIGNKRYQQVLFSSYFADMDDQELAQRFQVSVADIYLWRHRALKALRKKPEVMRILRSLL
jgi:RNA polymerase sigma factor (sigma-70 family)